MIVLAICGIFWFLTDFRLFYLFRFPRSVNNVWVFDWDCSESIYLFWYHGNFHINSTNLWTWNVFPFHSVFFLSFSSGSWSCHCRGHSPLWLGLFWDFIVFDARVALIECFWYMGTMPVSLQILASSSGLLLNMFYIERSQRGLCEVSRKQGHRVQSQMSISRDSLSPWSGSPPV